MVRNTNMPSNHRAPSRTWFYVTVLNPFGIIPIIGALIANAFPQVLDVAGSIGTYFGLEDWATMRSQGRTQPAFRWAFDVLFVILIPLNLLFTTLTGMALKAIAELQSYFDHKAGIEPGSDIGNRIKVAAKRVGTSIILSLVIAGTWITTHEPSSCKGCESGNILFYLFINWLGFQLLSNLVITQFLIAVGVLANRCPSHR